MGAGTQSRRLRREEILQASTTHFPIPCILRDGAGDSNEGTHIDAQCFLDESFRQRCQAIGYITPAVWGGPQQFRARDKISSGPQVPGSATSPLLSRRSSTLQSAGQNQQCPTRGVFGYKTPAALGGPQRFRAGDKITSGPQEGSLAT